MHILINGLQGKTHQTLMTPQMLMTELPLAPDIVNVVTQSRREIQRIMFGNDQRLFVVVGPCSIHDPKSAIEYADLLAKAATEFSKELCIAMRLYFEKPRTTLGWKGLISDPHLDGSFDMNAGLYAARKLLIEVNQLGLAAATEFLDPRISAYLSDLVAWCAIGARTSESQIHRELASYLPMIIGFKNSTDGNIQIAIDAVKTAAESHHIIHSNNEGILTVIKTPGNNACHIVLRGSNYEPNFSEQHIKQAINALHQAHAVPYLMIDCSHGNSMKNHAQQNKVIDAIISHRDKGLHEIRGIMIESNLIAGKQTLNRKEHLVYGQSVTDDCMGWDETYSLLKKLAHAIK